MPLTRSRFSLFIVLALLILCIARPASAFLYRTPEGSLKDNCVIWHEGTFHLFAMYRFSEKGGEQEQWRNVWSATSTDGVHWKDLGPVIKDAPFGIYAMRVWRAGDRFLMDHGSFTGDKQDVLRLWESRDLEHWTYLGPDFDIRRPDGQRIDHMDVIPVEEDGKTRYYGYAVGGVLRSEDGAKWTWLSELPLADNLSVRVVEEPGGCQRFGNNYYLLVGGFYPGSFEYAVATFIFDSPTGPFKPDYPMFRLNGYSGRELVALWACFCRLPNETLLSNYMLDPCGRFFWHAPLKKPVIDPAGHLRTGYWSGNDALKGEAQPCVLNETPLAFPNAAASVKASETAMTLEAPALPIKRWIAPDRPNIAAAFINAAFDFDAGCVIEGTLKVTASNGLVFPAAGLCLERKDGPPTAVFFGTWGQTLIGDLHASDPARFDPRDVTGFGCATVAGMSAGEEHRYRLLIRKGIFELYLDDLLVQTYSVEDLSGRFGFVVQDGKGLFGCPKVWKMALP